MDETRILVLDDEKETLDLVLEILAAPGRRIWTYQDPLEALRFLQDFRVDLVLTDVCMPGKNGLEVLAEVKRRWAETDVVLMTGYAEIDLAVQAMKQGATDFLSKPLRAEQLNAVVKKLIEFRAMRRRLRELENMIERACVLAPGGVLTPDLLSLRENVAPTRPSKTEPARDEHGAEPPLIHPRILESANPLEEAERATLQLTLERFAWNVNRVAVALKLSRSTLYAKASRYGLRRKGGGVLPVELEEPASREPRETEEAVLQHAGAAGG